MLRSSFAMVAREAAFVVASEVSALKIANASPSARY